MNQNEGSISLGSVITEVESQNLETYKPEVKDKSEELHPLGDSHLQVPDENPELIVNKPPSLQTESSSTTGQYPPIKSSLSHASEASQFYQSLIRFDQSLTQFTSYFESYSTNSSPMESTTTLAKAIPDPALETLFKNITTHLQSVSLQTERLEELLHNDHFYVEVLSTITVETNPIWDDIIQTQQGDMSAARRVADRIQWSPDRYQREVIKLRARINGKSPNEIRDEALTNGVILVLGHSKNDKLPILIQPESKWFVQKDQNLVTIRPRDLPFDTFWAWVQEEAVRAAGLWVTDQTYASTIIVTEPPRKSEDLHLAKFTSNANNTRTGVTRGRPLGSGNIKNRDDLLQHLRQALSVIKSEGKKVTQECVAEYLSNHELMGSENPDRQLRCWLHDFGINWKQLRTKL